LANDFYTFSPNKRNGLLYGFHYHREASFTYIILRETFDNNFLLQLIILYNTFA